MLTTRAPPFSSDVKIKCSEAVIVAQLVELLLPIPEVDSSNPVISKHLY